MHPDPVRRTRRAACCAALLLAPSFAVCAADGEAVYRATCSTCHDSGAGNAPRTGRADEWTERFAYGRPALHAAAIEGIPGTAMAAKGGFSQLSVAEVRAAVDHMLARTAYVEPASPRRRAAVVAAAAPAAAIAVADAVITARVAAAIRGRMTSGTAPVDADGSDLVVRGIGIRVSTAGGTVRLMGVVQDAGQVQRAEALVRAVEGVRHVENRLVTGGMLEFD